MSLADPPSLADWHTPRIDLSVLTNDRPKSLHRLLTSLQDAHYFGDDVSLSINLEQTADRVTQRIVDEFAWPVGTVALRHRIVLGGLMPAIVESWYPTSNDSYGVFLEDDVEVSPLFYGWLKFTILQYRYGDPTLRQDSARLFGVSLYQPKNVELLPEGRRPFDAHKLFASLSLSPVAPYLSQVPCSWGAVYFPEVWREFHSYLSLRLSEIALPISDTIVPDIKSNKWPRSWKKYFIELAYLRGYVMLYPNYASFFSLSTNHVEKGTHIKSDIDLAKRKALFEVPLMDRNQSLLALPEGRLPDWAELPLLDFWGSIATDEEVIERGWQTWSQLDTCKTSLRLDQPPTYNARELLCKRVYERVERLVEAQPLKPLPRLAPVVQGVGVDRPPLVVHPDAALGADVGAVGVVGDEEVDARAREGLRIDRELEARRAVGQGQGAILAAGVAPPSPVQAGPEQVELGDEEADIRLEDNEVEEEVETVEAVPVGEEAFEVEGEQERQEWAPVAQEEELLAEDGEGEVLNDERARK